ncbi:hypothetical protein EMILIAHAH_141 [Bacillus phage vB_BanH_Emiliahah]|nr:hypothetical protein EMILIAHAH_141 [Bacillus phage vB_BanH_Emiliahah]
MKESYFKEEAMNTFEILTVSLYAVISFTLVMNNINLYQETKRLKEVGQTPLVGRSAIVIYVAAVAELLVVTGFMWLCSVFPVPINMLTVFGMFLVGFMLRNGGSYLAAWVLWSIFVRSDRRKMMKEIKDEHEKALQ